MSGRRHPGGILGLGRGVSIGLFLVGFLLTCASAASALWTIPVVDGPSNIAIAEAGTLAAPTDPTATANDSHTITVAWTLPEGQLAGAKYRVTRTEGPDSEVDVCTVESTSCQDTGLVAGTEYEYSIKAVLGAHWESPAVVASATTLEVTTSSLASASIGATYSTTLVAIGGSGVYTWELSSGTLPTWASLDETTGEITGTPGAGAVGTTSELGFTVTDSLGGTATSGSLELIVTKGSTLTTVTPSVTTVNYGEESAADFVVTVRTANNALVDSGSVTVSVGAATCTVTLASASSCSIGDTALPAGGPYAVSATFTGNDDLISSTGTGDPVTVARAPATVSLTATGSPAVYGAESSLVFTAAVSASNGVVIPDGSTVAVTQDSTPLCIITLTPGSGTGSCSPASGTALPAGSYTVTATFNPSGTNPDFTSPTGTTTVTILPSGLAGIEWELVSTTGTLTCDFTNARAVTCTATGVGNKGSFQARVKLVGANRIPFTTAVAIPVSRITTGTGGTATPLGPLTIAPLASTTADSYTLTLAAGNPPTTTITASITVDGITYTVNCAVSK